MLNMVALVFACATTEDLVTPQASDRVWGMVAPNSQQRRGERCRSRWHKPQVTNTILWVGWYAAASNLGGVLI